MLASNGNGWCMIPRELHTEHGVTMHPEHIDAVLLHSVPLNDVGTVVVLEIYHTSLPHSIESANQELTSVIVQINRRRGLCT